MKVLPLWQPWASLVAIEAKRVETRHWPAPHRLLGQRKRLMEALDAGTLVEVDGQLPLGAIVCTAVLDRCSPITVEGARKLKAEQPDEHAFGNYSLNDGPRFAWVLRDVERLAEPVPWRGSQGIFDVPDELLGYSPPPRPEQGALL